MLYNTVEQELWRIFTFYALHADASQPDQLRPAIFLRFSKDCQIISKKLPPTVVELEVMRLLRSKADAADANASTSSSSASLISYPTFLQLLEILAVKMYVKDVPEMAVKRLLLENVLLLANRRVPSSELYDLDNAEANKVLRETFVKPLQKVFDYYLDKADKRRNQAVTSEKMRQKDLRLLAQGDLSSLQASKAQALQQLKEVCKTQKDLIGYKEYTQFCQDFSLKSTSLLTAVQVGEIYLNTVSFGQEMSFELFLRCLIYMAYAAYRDVRPSVTGESKAKALLLYMWKAVNDVSRTQRLLRSEANSSMARAQGVSQVAGSLNLFGSAPFSDAFLAHWMKDRFVDYASPRPAASSLSGAAMLKNVVKDDAKAPTKSRAGETEEILRTEEEANDHDVLEALQRNMQMGTDEAEKGEKEGPGQKPRRTNSIFIKPFAQTVRKAGPEEQVKRLREEEGIKRGKGVLNLDGQKLSILLQDRPELSEFLFLEIQKMKQSTIT